MDAGSVLAPKYHRQKFILALLELFGGNLTKIDLQKLLFLSQHEADFSYYDFVPYHYGCFSFQAHSDIELLEKRGWLKIDNKNVNLLSKTKQFLNLQDSKNLGDFYYKYKDMRGKSLIKYAYENYPYYAIKSKIASEILSKKSYKKINEEKSKLIKSEKTMFTIGYEGISFEAYVNKLLMNDIKLLCDVRNNPLSRKFGFSKGTLSTLLPKLGVKYKHIPSLGIPSFMRKELNVKEDYIELFKIYKKNLSNEEESLEELKLLVDGHERVALTCFEHDHKSCHRHCVSDYLELNNELNVVHI